ncbi:hypothetical protein [Massilia aerilata]|uniref:Uncharacterized protein n=1 Tax=Massilia aerilata TaxID=453817 RepID=A0ABW0S289_9BURK
MKANQRPAINAAKEKITFAISAADRPENLTRKSQSANAMDIPANRNSRSNTEKLGMK